MIELPQKPAQRWSEYLDAESRGTRCQKLESLDRFINSLLMLPNEIWMEWGIEFCRQCEAKKFSVPVRQPLFERVLFPALKHFWRSGVPGSLRLMAGLFDHLYRSKTFLLELPAELQSVESLLREELRLNPSDQSAGLMLISTMARYVAHTLHELPAGVLYGMDGASISECVELTHYIREFRNLVDQFGVQENYRELITDALFHYTAYGAYLQNGDHALGYREFLKTYHTD